MLDAREGGCGLKREPGTDFGDPAQAFPCAALSPAGGVREGTGALTSNDVEKGFSNLRVRAGPLRVPIRLAGRGPSCGLHAAAAAASRGSFFES